MCSIGLSACMPGNPIADTSWQRTASAPVPLADFFPDSGTVCMQSPYMTWEEIEQAGKFSVPFYVFDRDNSQDGAQIVWLFDKQGQYQTRFYVSRLLAADLSDNKQACYPIENQCFITAKTEEAILSNQQRVRYPVVMVQACTH